MSTTERAVHSVVFVLPDPGALGVEPATAIAAIDHLQALVDRALAVSRASVEHRVDVEFGCAATFLNSGVALTFVRVLQHLAGGEGGLAIRIGVHMGSLSGDDTAVEQRAPIRQARQFAILARTGHAVASPLFHNFVTQFDHRCKSMLEPLAPVVDTLGRSYTLFEIRFDELPTLSTATAALTGPASAADPLSLPAESEARQVFLTRVERLLAEEIGPLASLVVRRAAEAARTRTAFYHEIAATLPDEVQRADFFRSLDRL